MILTASLLLAATASLPQIPDLQLPPPAARQAAQPAQRPQPEIERFRRDLVNLRGSPAVVERTLQQMTQDYPKLEDLVIERMRPALARELLDLMVVARRVAKPTDASHPGDPRIGDEILFQLLSRPVGEATFEMVATLVALKGQDGKAALQECIRGRIAGVRRVANEALGRLATADDLPFALQLASEQNLDSQLLGIQLLAAVPVDAARQRLAELLAKGPAVAGAACAALAQVGEPALPALQQVLALPPIDRAFPYAALALLLIGDKKGELLVPAAVQTPLVAQLRGKDALSRALAAPVLAELAWQGTSVGASDGEIVAVLLEVVAPQGFVPNLDLLRAPAEAKLQKLSGRSGAAVVLGWREWWRQAMPDFAGMRARIELTPATLPLAVLSLRDEQRNLRLLGEGLLDLPPQAGATEFVLSKTQMAAVVAELQAAGFMTASLAPAGALPMVRQLHLQVQSARTQISAPAVSSQVFDQLAAIVQRAADQELWQQLRHPVDEPDRGAFWRSEQRWLEGNPDARERSRRLLQRIAKVWGQLPAAQRGPALAQLLAVPDRKELLAEEDGLQLLSVLRSMPALGEQELLLLELAAGAPGDRVWRDSIDLAWKAAGGGRAAADRVFNVLGADRVLTALTDARPEVRRAALDEVVQSRDQRAGPLVLKLFGDADAAVRMSAVYAAGQLQLADARKPLIERIVADGTDARLRRQALAALGRVGGEGVFQVLEQALGAPVAEDREAALRGLGELRDPRAAKLLAEFFTAGLGTQSGELARFYLQRMGYKLAVPALRALLNVQNPAVKNQLVLMLGSYQDPQVLPDLVAMLGTGFEPLAVTALLSCTIGLDVAGTEDRVATMETWLRGHRDEQQWQWLITACKVAQFKTSLEPAQFAPGASLQPVPELARIMVEGEPARLRVLAAAVLRTVSGEEFGQVGLATPIDVREAIASRYRVIYESARAAQGTSAAQGK